MSTPIPEWGGCPWPVDPACFGDDWDALDPEVQDRAVALASSTLVRLTGHRVGGCPITVRPCKAGCVTSNVRAYWDMQSAWGAGGFWPHIEGGVWVNSCGCVTDCSCTQLCEVELPGPVGRVDKVMLNGAAVAVDQYRVDGNLVVWVGGTDCPWPTCQDMAAADTEPGTFSITYLNSYPVDALGAYAAGVLSMEFARACVGSNKCRLPPGVTTVTRAGVSYEVASGTFPGGVTGIREVDAFIALWNPGALRQQTQVWSPDLRSPRVVAP